MKSKIKYTKKNLDWVNTPFLLLSPPIAVFLLYLHLSTEGFVATQWISGFVFYMVTGLAITAGYHRLFSHKTYKTNSIVKFFYLVFGAATFQNSALKWCTDHRRHHGNVDQETDPYNINEGFFYAHIGWILLKEKEQYKDKFAKDLVNDPLVLWQHKYYYAISIFSGLVLPTIAGYLLGSALGGLAIAGLGRLVVVHHFTFFINSACHVFGKQPYVDTHTARDSAWLAIFTYGEGYHNFHHTFQNDYRNGVRWYQYDPAKWLINCLSWIGSAKGLKRTPAEDILIARVAMQEKTLAKRLGQEHQSMPILHNMRLTLETSLSKLQELKKEYQLAKSNRVPSKNLQELKSHLKRAKHEVKEEWNRWQEFSSAVYAL
jgi:stearoyl-CoA desaturase (delta-9 desaturase)